VLTDRLRGKYCWCTPTRTHRKRCCGSHVDVVVPRPNRLTSDQSQPEIPSRSLCSSNAIPSQKNQDYTPGTKANKNNSQCRCVTAIDAFRRPKPIPGQKKKDARNSVPVKTISLQLAGRIFETWIRCFIDHAAPCDGRGTPAVMCAALGVERRPRLFGASSQ
jgi:hypothetical protein